MWLDRVVNMLYPQVIDEKCLTYIDKFKVRLFGSAYIIKDSDNYDGPLNIYLAYCDKHKTYFLDHKRGRFNYLLCPKHLEEYAPETIGIDRNAPE